VLAHLKECAECRAERDRQQAVARFVAEDASPVPDHRFAFRKLMKRIEDHEENLASMREVASERRWRAFVPYGGIAASLAGAALFAVLLSPAGDEPATSGSEFRTLTSSEIPRGAMASRRVALTFEKPLPAEAIRSTLIETRSNIVAGPDEGGTWIVEIEVPDSVTPGEFIDSLERLEGVRYAAYQPAAAGRRQ